MANKSTTCFKKDGSPLTVYYSEHEAQEGAAYVNSLHGLGLVPYLCQKCRHWHLSPKNRITPSRHCSHCNKELYDTEEDAENRAIIIEKEREIMLSVYRCQHHDGWHLTSSVGW
jgi:hypothetical protein